MRDFFGFVVSLIFTVYGFTYSLLMIYSSVGLFLIYNINTARILSVDGWRNGWLISIAPTTNAYRFLMTKRSHSARISERMARMST